MAAKLISEILSSVEKEPSRKKKVELLKANKDNNALRTILKGTFDKSIVFELPEGAPPYTSVPGAEDNYGGLYSEFKKFYLFTKNNNTSDLNPIKRERLFIEMLEILHPDEANLVIAMKDRKLPYKGITEKLVKEAFPELIK